MSREQTGHRKQDCACKQATATSKDISDTAGRDNQRGERQHVAVESPLKVAQICVQILTERNQRYVDRRDIGVQDREHDGDHEQS